MVTTRGGGKVPERIEDNYRSFLESHFGTRQQRRAHVRKGEQAAKKRAAATRVRVAPVKPVPVRKVAAPKKRVTTKKAPTVLSPKAFAITVSDLKKNLASGATKVVPSQPQPLVRRPSQRSLVEGLKGMLSAVKNLELLLVIDGSGSMGCGVTLTGQGLKSPTRFDAVRSVCDKIPDAFGPGRKLRVGIVQFGDTARVECPLVVDHAQFQTAAREMVFMRSGTERGLPRAFEHARDLLKGERGAKKMMIFLTDGGSVNQSVVDTSTAIQSDNTTVIVVGVGVEMQRLDKIATGDHSYSMDNFQQVLDIVKESY